MPNKRLRMAGTEARPTKMTSIWENRVVGRQAHPTFFLFIDLKLTADS
jgi:hypothetical protein